MKPKPAEKNTLQAHDLGLALAATFILIVILYLSYATFTNYKYQFQQLRHGNWTSSSFSLTKDFQLKVEEYPNGDLYLNTYSGDKKIYHQNCKIGLNYLCKHLQIGDIQPQTISFYHLSHKNILDAQILLLHQLKFTDQEQQVQTFNYTHSSPNNAQYIHEHKGILKRFYFFTLLSYSLFGYFTYSHRILRYSTNETAIELINTTVLLILVSSYFYFGISYFFF